MLKPYYATDASNPTNMDDDDTGTYLRSVKISKCSQFP